MIETIGRFQIRRELGRGAQSVVYLGFDPHLEREVAIKTVHYEHGDAKSKDDFLAEARLVSNLRHANVVPIFEAGEAAGDPYLVFERVDGKTLAQLIKEGGKLPAAKAAAIMRGVLDGVDAAHRQDIIHRDLKPSNILIDANVLPRVMDFGVSARLKGGESRRLDLVGTPAYLAPEYVKGGPVSVRIDIYAAGLILLEMLTGRRAVEGTTVAEILDRIANVPISIPRNAGIDDRLADIILKAVTAEPEKRYASAAQMREALDGWLDTGNQALPIAGDKQSTLEFLLRRMRHKTDFPALSESVSAINRLANSEKEGVNTLSNTILKDFALTNKILRLVNSVFYRQAGGGNISTVSRAVVVLGFDSVRNIAITLLLFEHLQDKGNANDLKEGFLRANLAGLLARQASQKMKSRDAEEAYVCALFHSLGQLLAQYYFPEETEEVRKLQQRKHCKADAAALQVLGISFEDLGIGIARSWGFPVSIVHSMRGLGEGPVRPPGNRDDALRVVSGFANEMCELIAALPAEQRQKATRLLADRFAASLKLKEDDLDEVLEASCVELTDIAAVLHVNLKESAFARQTQGWVGAKEPEPTSDNDDGLADTVLGGVLGGVSVDETAASSEDAQSILAAGIQDISNALVEEASLNDILRITLETIYRAMGFRRVLLCLRDPKTRSMVGRFGFGTDSSELAKVFRFSLDFTPDVFHAAMAKGVDIFITDVDDAKIAERIPGWYREKVAAKTFVLFPILIKGNPVALIYCDHERPGAIVIEERVLSLLKTLRNQALLAIRSAG
jgi:serine/threonine protein kinase